MLFFKVKSISYVGRNRRLVLNEVKPNVYREYLYQGNNRIIRCYSIIAIPSLQHRLMGFTPHVGLRYALHQPTPAPTHLPHDTPTRIKAPSITKPALAPLLLCLIPLMAVAALKILP
jgi:hypothetical protein